MLWEQSASSRGDSTAEARQGGKLPVTYGEKAGALGIVMEAAKGRGAACGGRESAPASWLILGDDALWLSAMLVS
jgi:hypothetical protein